MIKNVASAYFFRLDNPGVSKSFFDVFPDPILPAFLSVTRIVRVIRSVTLMTL